MEAQQHFKKCDVYKMHPEFIQSHRLDDIITDHEDTHEFLKTVYKQCAVWREKSTLIGQISRIKQLEDTARKLETTIDHLFYVVENIQNKKNRIMGENKEEEACESVTRH